MILKRHLHFEGYIKEDYDSDIFLTDKKSTKNNDEMICQEDKLACRIAKELTGEEPSYNDEACWDTLNVKIPKCKIMMYFTKQKESLDSVEVNQLKSMLGDITIDASDYGWSEWTIEGFSVDELTIGGHDLHNILRENCNKYVHIIIDVL